MVRPVPYYSTPAVPTDDRARGPRGRDFDHPHPDTAAASRWPEADHHAGGRGDAGAKADPRRDLIKALIRADRWRRRIESGHAKSVTDLGEQEGVTDAYVCRLLPLTYLAPDIVETILDGRQPRGLRLAELLGTGPLVWKEQRGAWGFLSELCALLPAQDQAQIVAGGAQQHVDGMPGAPSR